MPDTLPMLTIEPPSPRLQDGVGGLGAVEGRQQVEGHHRGEEAGGGLGRRHVRRAAGVVDQHVEPPHALGRAVDEGLGLVGLAHVGLDEGGCPVDPSGPTAVGSTVGRRVPPADHHLGPGGQERLGNGPPHAPAAAGHRPPPGRRSRAPRRRRRPSGLFVVVSVRPPPRPTLPAGSGPRRAARRPPSVGRSPTVPRRAHRDRARTRRCGRGGDRPPAGERPRRGGVVRAGRRAGGRRAVTETTGGGAAGRGPGLLRRGGHQGDPGRGRRAPWSGSTGAAPPPSPPSTTARCRSSPPSAGSAWAAASAWSATPTSWSPPTTPPSVCPRSTGGPSGRPPTWPGWCPSTRCARWSTRPSRSPPPSWRPTGR